MKKIESSLFNRLLIYFITILFVPILIISAYMYFEAENTIDNFLVEKAQSSIKNQTQIYAELIEEYRHKAYEISNNEELINILENKGDVDSSIYEYLYSVLKGDVYKASVSVESVDGNIRLSSHTFPQRYDLRSHSSSSETFNVMVEKLVGRSTKIVIENRYVNDKGDIIVLSLFRNIYNREGKIVGYLVVDIFDNTITQYSKTNNFFDELLLLQGDKYVATSLFSPNIYGDYSNFSFMNLRDKGPLKSKVYKGNNEVLAIEKVGTTDLFIAGYIEKSPIVSGLNSFAHTILFAIIFGLALALYLAYIFASRISNPIKEVVKSMHQVEDGNLTIQISENSIKEINELNSSFNNMVIKLVKLLQQLQENSKKTIQAEKKALESQLNPHFLFNTLNTIKSLARINGQDEIYQISLKLGSLLRNSLNNEKEYNSISESVDILECYLTIQQIRFVDKLEVQYDIDEEVSSFVIPKLIIQPLVENSIKHGLEPKIGKWLIKISIKKKNDKINIKVIDNGVGIDKKILLDDYSLLEKTKHVGVYNIYRRLQLCYNGDAKFSIYRDDSDEYTIAEIEVPIKIKLAGIVNEL